MGTRFQTSVAESETFCPVLREEIIVKKIGILVLVVFGISAVAHGQFPQMRSVDERIQKKNEEVTRAEEERKRMNAEKQPKQPVIKPAIMNVDVQMALTKLEYKTFAAAKPFSVTSVADGDPLWLYVRFNGKLGDYVYTMRSSDGTERYILFVEYGPQGDVTARSHQLLEFRKDELALTELKMSLSPGKAGRNNALAIFIKNVAAARPGLWNNELRISRTAGFPRSINDYLAKTGFICDFSKGLVKYPAMIGTFKSMVLRDTTDESVLPIVGKFDNTLARMALVEKLASEGIAPSQVYFSGDIWLEYSDFPMSVRQYRTVTGVFLYQRESKCYYGTAEITQPFDSMNDTFGDSTITLDKDIPVPCSLR